jgi:hypothetical protein
VWGCPAWGFLQWCETRYCGKPNPKWFLGRSQGLHAACPCDPLYDRPKRSDASQQGTFWQWSEQVRAGQASKKNIKIALIDLRGSVIVQFNVYNSFPDVWTVSNDNLGNRAVEEFAIATAGVELVR